MSNSIAAKSLADWLARIEAGHPTEIDLGLDRVSQVAGRLNLNFSQSKVITVAGTNGKGSSCSLLEAILQADGKSTGVYSSPHFIDYNERIRINGLNAEDEVIVNAFEAIDAVRGEISLTYFEYGTLAALKIFADAQLDFVILEVGLGGRLDAVNIIDADIAVITSIALDHIDWLGDSLESIGREKAGIFRAAKPAVIGLAQPPRSIIQHSSELNTPLYIRDQDFHMDLSAVSWNWAGLDKLGEHIAYLDLPLPKLPVRNAATVLQVLSLIAPDCPIEAIHKGLATADLTGRMQRAQLGDAEMILDVAHNPEAANYLAQQLFAEPANKKRTLVLGMLKDKDREAVIEALKPVVDSWKLVSLQGPRASTAAELKNLLGSNLEADLYDSTQAALSELEGSLSSDDQVLVCGSFLTVTEALAWLKTR